MISKNIERKIFFMENSSNQDKIDHYKFIHKQLIALHKDENDHIAILANATALLHQFLKNINWVGFYLWKHEELVLGPFQGLPACIRIAYGKGVCGTAVKERKTQRVADVEQFPGHIVCDVASKSEIVIPIFINEKIYGVLDIDSPIKNRFDETDQTYLEKLVNILEDLLT